MSFLYIETTIAASIGQWLRDKGIKTRAFSCDTYSVYFLFEIPKVDDIDDIYRVEVTQDPEEYFWIKVTDSYDKTEIFKFSSLIWMQVIENFKVKFQDNFRLTGE